MEKRTEFVLQILEKIGTPLLSAILAVPKDQIGPEAASKTEAETIAALLGKTVHLSIELSKILDIDSAGEKADAVRLAAAGLASPIIARQYLAGAGKLNDQDAAKLVEALNAVLSFSENYLPAEEHEIRLQQIVPEGIPGDSYQINIQFLNAFMPTIQAIAAFPYGQPEKKLVQEVSARLTQKAMDLREKHFPNLSANEQKLVELSFLRPLAGLYADCHNMEMRRLMALDEAARNQLIENNGGKMPMDGVWNALDIRMEMLEALAQNMAPDANAANAAQASGSQGSGGAAPQQPPPQPQPPPSAAAAAEQAAPPPVNPPPAQEPPAQEQAPPQEAPPAAEPQQPAEPPAKPAGGNPMAMFAKPKAGGDTPPPASPPPNPPPAQEPPPAPPQEASPPAQEPPPPVTPPPAQEPPAEPPTQPVAPPEQPPPTPPSEEQGGDDQSGSGDDKPAAPPSSPMGFFAKKNDDED